jgi:ribosome-associated protein
MAPVHEPIGLFVQPGLSVPDSELEVSATRAGGPGGQHVNTSSTRVEVRWRVATSRVLSDAQRARLTERLAGRLDADGTVRVVASDTRSQRQNRALAEERLAALIRRALVVPKVRRKTKPGRAAVERRLSEKRLRSAKKRDRRGRPDCST